MDFILLKLCSYDSKRQNVNTYPRSLDIRRFWLEAVVRVSHVLEVRVRIRYIYRFKSKDYGRGGGGRERAYNRA